MTFEEKLINLVKMSPYLYDSSQRDYRHKAKKDDAWLTISEELNTTVEVCQTKWRSLRDRFSREMKKLNISSPKKLHSSWLYFNDLLFLKETIKLLKTKNYINEETQDSSLKFDIPTTQNFTNDSLFECEKSFIEYDGNITTYSNNNNNTQILTTLFKEIIQANAANDTENMMFMKSVAMKMEVMPKPDQRDLQMEILSLVHTRLSSLEK